MRFRRSGPASAPGPFIGTLLLGDQMLRNILFNRTRQHRAIRSSRVVLSVELLETRLAPATLVNPTTITYQDTDGDVVTLRLSKPIFTSVETANQLLTFDTGNVMTGAGSNAT